jgi:hypothetical protein
MATGAQIDLTAATQIGMAGGGKSKWPLPLVDILEGTPSQEIRDLFMRGRKVCPPPSLPSDSSLPDDDRVLDIIFIKVEDQ